MLTGEEEGQWVEVEGVVHSERETETDVTLDLALSDGKVSGTTPKEPGRDYNRLIDAKVKIHANVAPFFNVYRQLAGAHLFFPSMVQVQIEEPPPLDAFALPLRTISSLLRYDPDIAFRRRVYLRGRVTLQWPSRFLRIQDATQGLCARTTETTPLDVGEVVDMTDIPIRLAGPCSFGLKRVAATKLFDGQTNSLWFESRWQSTVAAGRGRERVPLSEWRPGAYFFEGLMSVTGRSQ